MVIAGGSSSMENSQYQRICSTSLMTEEFSKRPKFKDAARVKKHYSCSICNNILLQPHQTSCGYRVCKKCIDEKFGDLSVIRCPLSHDDLEEEELKEEICQQEGLEREFVVPDLGSQRLLLKEKCFCENQQYGCCDNPIWKKLKEHQTICAYTPERCPNQGCYKPFAKQDLAKHEAECGFAVTQCNFCKLSFKRKEMEDHYGECEYAESECTICKTNIKRKQLMIHQKTHPPCLTNGGKCYYFDYCGFENPSVEVLRKHLTEDYQVHLESLAVKVHDLEQASTKTREMYATDVKRTVNSKVKPLENQTVKETLRRKVLPLEKATAEISMKVKKLTNAVNQSETSGNQLMNAIGTVSQSSQQIEAVQEQVGAIERQIRDSGLVNKFSKMPSLNAAKLKKLYGCTICKDLSLLCYQTPGGHRVCQECISRKFGIQSTIACPLPHDPDGDLASANCLLDGLSRDKVTPDYAIRNILLREKCFCKYKDYGCLKEIEWEKLQEHEKECIYIPQSCPNGGCTILVPTTVGLRAHLMVCEFAWKRCNFCFSCFQQKNLQDHYGKCQFAEPPMKKRKLDHYADYESAEPEIKRTKQT